MGGILSKLPDWLESRKFAWGLLTFGAVIFLAIVGTIISAIGNVSLGLIETAMFLLTGTGVGGVTNQAFVDRARVSNDPSPTTRTWGTRTTQPVTPIQEARNMTSILSHPASQAEQGEIVERQVPKSLFGSD